MKISKLAEKLVYGDQPTRLAGIEEFNKLPAEAQQKLVPDFMVAMSDEDPEARKIASRILKAMGVQAEAQVPDAKKEIASEKSKTKPIDKWEEEKRLKQEASQDKWADLRSMRSEEQGGYASMKQQLESEKKGQVWIDPSQLTTEALDKTSPLGSVTEALRDSDPWVRAQAARRLGTIRPAPVEAIPDLIAMLGENIPESRRAAAAALGSFGPLAEKALPALTTALSDPDPATRQIAQEAIKQIQMHP